MRNKIIETICFALILLFAYAGMSKLLDFEKFNIELSKSPLLAEFAGLIARVLPPSEILLAITLVIPRFRFPALIIAFNMMSMFTVYILAILLFSDNIPCSCGGILQGMSWNQHLVFNTIFLVMTATSILLIPVKHDMS